MRGGTYIWLLCGAAALSGCRPSGSSAPAGDSGRFADSISLPATTVKNQGRSGTCWAFGTVSLLESELLRSDPARSVDLSEMWFVRQAYREKAIRYVRTQGAGTFSQGGELHDAIRLAERCGIVPQAAYEGRSSDGAYRHGRLARAVSRWAKRTVRRKEYERPGCFQELERLLDRYLGPCPERFVVDGVEYTPLSYADSLALRLDRYVSLTSFTHRPYYRPFVLEVADNWMAEPSMNVPLDTLVGAVNRALARGFTVGWNADISEPGFRWKAGIAGVRRDASCSPESRQQAFDTQQTTDDHTMHIVGLVRRDDGRLFYKVKNSWGTENARDGFIYVSENYFRMKTIEILLPKEALSGTLCEKCGWTE